MSSFNGAGTYFTFDYSSTPPPVIIRHFTPMFYAIFFFFSAPFFSFPCGHSFSISFFEFRTVGDIVPTHGFSSFKFLPGTQVTKSDPRWNRIQK